MNNLLKNSVLACIGISLAGCASIVSKSHWPVTINSSPVGARVMIYDKSGCVLCAGETPMTISLGSSNGFFQPARYRIELTKPGYAPQGSFVSAHLNPWYVGNIVFGGLIGILIVDPATGAMWKLPDTYVAVLPPKVASIRKPGQLTIASINDVPAHLRSELTKIN